MLERQQATARTLGIRAHSPIHTETAGQRQEMLATARTVRAATLAPSVRLEIARQPFDNLQEAFVQAGSVGVLGFHG